MRFFDTHSESDMLVELWVIYKREGEWIHKLMLDGQKQRKVEEQCKNMCS